MFTRAQQIVDALARETEHTAKFCFLSAARELRVNGNGEFIPERGGATGLECRAAARPVCDGRKLRSSAKRFDRGFGECGGKRGGKMELRWHPVGRDL